MLIVTLLLVDGDWFCVIIFLRFDKQQWPKEEATVWVTKIEPQTGGVGVGVLQTSIAQNPCCTRKTNGTFKRFSCSILYSIQKRDLGWGGDWTLLHFFWLWLRNYAWKKREKSTGYPECILLVCLSTTTTSNGSVCALMNVSFIW